MAIQDLAQVTRYKPNPYWSNTNSGWINHRFKCHRSRPSALPLVTAYDNGPSSVVISTMDSLPSTIIGRNVPSSPSLLVGKTSCSRIPPMGLKPVPPYTASLKHKGQWIDTIQLSHAFTDGAAETA